MPKVVEGVEYLTVSEAVQEIGVSRQTFYDHIKGYLRPYHFGRKAPYYSKQEVISIATGKPMRKGTIPITGIFSDWTEYARSLGYNAQTESRAVEIIKLPEDLAAIFDLSPDQLFVKRGRMTTVDGAPICYWDTFYPLQYVGDILSQMQQGTASGIVEHMKDRHGVVIGKVKDRYSTRVTTMDELNLFHLFNDEPVLLLQRASWTKDKQTVVLFSDMVLLGSWFVVEREEEIAS